MKKCKRFMVWLLSWAVIMGIVPAYAASARAEFAAGDCTVSAGYYHSLAITADGTLYAWGYNKYGELGNGTSGNYANTPQKIMDNVVSASAGREHSLTVTADGTLYAWGDNLRGQLGNGTRGENMYAKTPQKIMDNVVSASAGSEYSLAVTADGLLYAWGYNWSGQLGNGTSGTNTSTNTPQKIMDNVVSASAGREHSLTVTADGTLYAWGDNHYGEFGNGTNKSANTPQKIMDNVVSASAGGNHSLAITADGALYAWGYNWSGQLGNGTTEDANTPQKIMNNVVSASAGGDHSLAITADGTLYAWGNNNGGQLGNGTGGTNASTNTPQKIMDNVISASAGYNHSLAVTADGTLYAWGNNNWCKLGNGAIENADTPQKIMDNIMLPGGARVQSAAEPASPSDWAQSEVTDAIDAGLIPDELQTEYRAPVTRREFCMLVERLVRKFADDSWINGYIGLNMNNGIRFADTDDSSVLTAAGLSIVNGYDDGTFKPDNTISREEAAVMISRCKDVAENACGYGLKGGGVFFFGDIADSFTDGRSISSWAADGVKYVYTHKDPSNDKPIMGDAGGGAFDPQGSYTREQGMISFKRFYNVLVQRQMNEIHDAETDEYYADKKERQKIVDENSTIKNAIEELDEAINEYAEALDDQTASMDKKDIDAVAEKYDINALDSDSEKKFSSLQSALYEAMYSYTEVLADSTEDISKLTDGNKLVKALGKNLTGGRYSVSCGGYDFEIYPMGYGTAAAGTIKCTKGGSEYTYAFNTNVETGEAAVAEFMRQNNNLAAKLGEETVETVLSEISKAVTGTTPVEFLSKKIKTKANDALKKVGMGNVNKTLGEWYAMYECVDSLHGVSNSDILGTTSSIDSFMKKADKIEKDTEVDTITDAVVKKAASKVNEKYKELKQALFNYLYVNN